MRGSMRLVFVRWTFLMERTIASCLCLWGPKAKKRDFHKSDLKAIEPYPLFHSERKTTFLSWSESVLRGVISWVRS